MFFSLLLCIKIMTRKWLGEKRAENVERKYPINNLPEKVVCCMERERWWDKSRKIMETKSFYFYHKKILFHFSVTETLFSCAIDRKEIIIKLLKTHKRFLLVCCDLFRKNKNWFGKSLLTKKMFIAKLRK